MDEDTFFANLKAVRQAAGDRGTLRAVHVFAENHRVAKQTQALQEGDFDTFLHYVTESGISSWRLLQNVVPAGRKENQEVAYCLAVAQQLLGGHGACRVHGGGFAGTIQAFVPLDILEAFRTGIDAVLGEGACHVLSIRPQCGVPVVKE